MGGGGRISENHLLENLNGLGSLVSAGGNFNISYNDGLINLEGLESLHTVTEWFIVGYNSSLTSFNGVEELTTVWGALMIQYNGSLLNLSGLENVSTVWEKIILRDNINLTSISALNKVLENSSVINVVIKNNSALSNCSIPNLCLYLEGSNVADIVNNAEGCNSIDEVKFACNDGGAIFYPIYFDVNENGLLDAGEPFSDQAAVLISPTDLIAFTNPDNNNLVYLPEGIHTITFHQANSPNWIQTSVPTSYTVNVAPGNPPETVYFGIHPLIDWSDLGPYLSSGDLRCNNSVLFNVAAKNRGSLPIDGTMWLKIDENITGVEFVDDPDIVDGSYLFGWNFTDLAPNAISHKQIKLFVPGPPQIPLGETLLFSTFTDYTDLNGVYESDTFSYKVEMECAYDPNDKLVNPERMNNYTLFEEDLSYTIRFQNTGNAEAYDVIIRDTLDPNLNPNTFHVINSSHKDVLITTIQNDQFLTFKFKNIFLPDSTTNFEASQGYIAYSIKANENLPENTAITNSASI